MSPSLFRTVILSVLLLGAGGPAVAQTAGREPDAAQPWEGGATIVDLEHPVTAAGTLRVWRAHSSQGARVMLKVWRREGGRLLLVGTSSLETLLPGVTGTFTCSIPVARNDLVGCYCPDAACVDRFSDGLAATAAGDLGTVEESVFATGQGEPALAASGDDVVDVPSPVGTDLVLPVAARTPGFNGTVWRTALEIFNTGTQDATVSLLLDASGLDNTEPAASAQLLVPARDTVVVEDLLLEVFGLEQASGAVDVLSTQPLMVHARILNTGSGGTYGQLVPAVPAAWSVGAVQAPGINPNAAVLSLFEAREDASSRTNLGVVNVSGVPTAVSVAALRGGVPVGSPLALELPPYSHVQVNRVLAVMEVPAGGAPVRLAVTPAPGAQGRILAYASRVDNVTGDAVFLPGWGEPPL